MQDYEYIIRGGIGSRGSWLLCDMGSVPDSGGCEGWNFGPENDSVSTVWEVVTELVKNFEFGVLKDSSDLNAVHEANLLTLDINKVKTRLGWKPRLNMQQCIALVADWYKRYKTEDVYNLCVEEIDKFIGR